MRLTLRTLLAWLDDTLPPEEVREIGSQVSETPYAQSLIERIRTVTRRRRLTVPPASGPEAVDPNLVAAYLDNELEAEKVADYEKVCLASDVHLAEVASCHQILSLIKNKAKVPPEARYRMYRLSKGPEAVRTNYRSAAEAGVVPGDAGAGAGPPWARSAPESPSLFERLGPPLVAVALILVLGIVGYLNLRYADEQIRFADSQAGLAGGEGPLRVPGPDGPPARPAPPLLPTVEREPEPEAAEPADAAPEPEAQPEPDGSALPIPDGAVAVVEQADGVALRAARGGANRDWERLAAGDELAPGDRVVTLAPFRTTLALGPARLTMIAQSEIRADRPGLADVPGFELIDGSVVLRSSDPERAVSVRFEGLPLTLTPPPGRPVGLSWLGLKSPGEASGRPLLTILVPEGSLRVAAEGDDEPREFEGPVIVSVDPEDGILGAEPAVMPRWVVDAEPLPADIRAGEAFAGLFDRSSGSITFTLLEGMEDPDPTVRSLSVAALGAMAQADPGVLEQVMPLLNRRGDPAIRATAIGIVLRQIGRGAGPAAEVRTLLERFVDPPEAAEDLDRLLTGFSEAQLGEEALAAALVADLASPNPSVRQLALETLLLITGREDHGYDPDAPEGPGLKFWQDLLKEGRIAPPGRPAPAPPRPGSNSGDRRR